MTLEEVNKKYDSMQNEYGDKSLNSILNGGKIDNPEYCFIFMNPTKRNIATEKIWNGIRSPWIGTKNVWTIFYKIGLLNEDIYNKIRSITGKQWNEEFANLVYEEVTKKDYYITNLGKCSQLDARPLPDKIFKEYLELLYKEIEIVNPKKIILFGNQVSSIVLNEKISVSNVRKKEFIKNINGTDYSFYPVYYPIGNGSFNLDKALEDLNYIINNNK